MKVFRLGIILLLLGLGMSACTKPEPETVKLEEAEITLKVATIDTLFQNSFLKAIEQKYPKLTLEFINEGYYEAVETSNWKEWLETIQPDLIVSIYPEMYSGLVDEGLLVPLDSWIIRDQIDLDAFVPGVIEWLRSHDDRRQLYGLAHDFQNKILLYNTEHFDRLKIPYPSRKMTWTEVLELAQRFQYDHDQIYGLQQHALTPFQFIVEIGRTEELLLYHPETGEVYAGSEAWKSIWEQVLKSYESNSIKDQLEWLPTDAAMVIHYLNGMNDYEQIVDLTRGSDWKMAYFPINGENPDASHAITVNRPISIYAKSVYPEYAWELLKFIMSEDMTRYSNIIIKGLPSRLQAYTKIHTDDSKILYDTQPKQNTIPDVTDVLPNLSHLRELYGIGDRIFAEVLAGKSTLDEGLKQLERELEELIRQAKHDT